MQREDCAIVHSDIDHCYAQIKEMKYPGLWDAPMTVGGNEEKYRRVILARSDKTKVSHIRTGESLQEVLAKCPQSCVLKPDYEEYIYYTERVKDIYCEYTDRVGLFGLDEAWIDLSGSTALFDSGMSTARKIQNCAEHGLGTAVSMGVSYNKIFARIGSDVDKHKGLAEIIRENHRERIWPLPVQDLFYVRKVTKHKLTHYSVETIGQLARLPQGWMKDHFREVGELIWWSANGEDVPEIALSLHQEQAKSVGNVITAPRDIKSFEDAKIMYYTLTESVTFRLREQGFRDNVISVTL